MDDVYVYYIKLPDGVNEAILSCTNGYTIYIDPRQSEEGMRRSFQHAMDHIRNADYDKTDVQIIEKDAHKERRKS